MSNAALHVQDLTLRLGGRQILSSVSLEVSSGSSLAIMGRSGSGKTSLLSCALGMLRPSSGSIHVMGRDVTSMRRDDVATFRSRTIGMVFQHAELLPHLSALENVALPALLIGTDATRAHDRANGLLADLGVAAPDTSARDLSGGERQRVALARALVNEPALVLADEPTGSLDAELRDAAARLLMELPERTGCALVVVTHDPAVARLADAELRLKDGTLESGGLAASGSGRAISGNTDHPRP